MRRQMSIFWALMAMLAAPLGRSYGQVYTIYDEPDAAIVCAGLSSLSGNCDGRLVVRVDGSVTYYGQELTSILEKLNANPDRYTVFEVGFAVEELAALASHAQSSLSSTGESILKSTVSRSLPTLRAIMGNDGEAHAVRSASADALTRIVKNW